MSTETTNTLVVSNAAALTSFFKDVVTSKATGLPLYERVEAKGTAVLSLTVKESNKSVLYFAVDGPTGESMLVRTPARIYDMLNDDDFTVGEQVLAEVYWRAPIQDIDDVELQARYGDNKNAIANYKQELKQGASHLYIQTLSE